MLAAGGVLLGQSGTAAFARGITKTPVTPTRASILPSGVTTLKGVNLVVCPGQPGYNYANAWPALFDNANWTAGGWANLEAQITLCQSLGINAVRLIGGMGAIAQGTATLPQYIAEYEQFVAYCQSAGLYVLAVGPDLLDLSGVPQATVIALAQDLLEMLNGYSNVVYLDIVSEIMGQLGSPTTPTSTIVAYAKALYQNLKPYSKIPMGFSHSYPFNDPRVAALAPYCDVLDFHIYPPAQTAAALTTLLSTYPTKPLIMGECGDDVGDSTANQSAFMSYLLGIVENSACDGCWLWAAVDQVAPTGGTSNFGLYPTVTGSLRQPIGGAFKAFPA